VDEIVVRGPQPLSGEVEAAGSKNAVLPALFATLLTRERCVLRNVPRLADVRTACRLLERLGVRVESLDGGRTLSIDPGGASVWEAPRDLVNSMRASFLVLGPLLARFGRASVSHPGGCAIGKRPVHLHLAGLEQMGALIQLDGERIDAAVPRLRGATIRLELPAVGATEQLMMAATVAVGTTVIENAACEPEIEDLAQALDSMGARVSGAGTPTITIRGAGEIGGMDHTVIPDRIEAGTFMVAGAITGGDVHVVGARADHLGAFLFKLREAGVEVHETSSGIRVARNGVLRAVDMTTEPYPGFPTDLQAQMTALMTHAHGQSVVTETIFENRLMHVQELRHMGAQIRVDENKAIVDGPTALRGAPVVATDLRASGSLVLAGLAATGTTRIARVYHLDRGYERIEEKLSMLGADIQRVSAAAGTAAELGAPVS
jgi:UDP-N-acetylglucosamine 1-carboxyvinyltransferase